jgi:hypothetical protein
MPWGENDVKRRPIELATAGSHQVVAAVANREIRVLGVFLMGAGDVDISFRSEPTGTRIIGTASLAADGNGYVLPVGPPVFHWAATNIGEGLFLHLNAAVAVGGVIVYYDSEPQ